MAELIHYEGDLGIFDYDPNAFKFEYYSDLERHFLYYIGHETDGHNIHIPEGIIDCSFMFQDNGSLITAPMIPQGVLYCEGMFNLCPALKEAPVIPSSVVWCPSMFDGCESLILPPVIPESVTYCDAMFYGCKSLVSSPSIPESVELVEDMFYGCSDEVQMQGQWNIEHRGMNYLQDLNFEYTEKQLNALYYVTKQLGWNKDDLDEHIKDGTECEFCGIFNGRSGNEIAWYTDENVDINVYVDNLKELSQDEVDEEIY